MTKPNLSEPRDNIALVSLCIPNYNMAAFLGPTLESALAQSYEAIEVVVVDNASNDGSLDIIQAFARRDPRVRWSRNPATVPMAENWNRCLDMAQGQYFNLLSADDLLNPDFVTRCMALFAEHPHLAYVAAERDNIDPGGNITTVPPFYDASAIIPGLEQTRVNLLAHHFLPVQLLIRRDLATKLGNYDQRYDYACDIDLMIKLSLHGDVGYIQDKLCLYRTHANNMTSNYKKTKLGVMEIYRLKHHILNALPEEALHLQSLRDKILTGLTRVCMADARNALLSGNRSLASEHLALARALTDEVHRHPLFAFLERCLQDLRPWSEAALTAAWKTESPQESNTGNPAPPYPLPPLSRPLQRGEFCSGQTGCTIC